MLSSLFKICPACKKRRLRVVKRTFFSDQLKTLLTSNNPLCRKCINNLKK